MGCMLMLSHVNKQKEIFFFCFELLCKCLVILYGENNRLNLSVLRIQDLEFVKTKMKQLCVKVNTIEYDIQTARLIDMDVNCNLMQNSLNVIMAQYDNEPLKNYIIQVQVDSTIIEISFEIIASHLQHNVTLQ
tara:strand:+ start:5629 stop:6027 length:399 start_codon:yes stop_codon:yes gene_type:complete